MNVTFEPEQILLFDKIETLIAPTGIVVTTIVSRKVQPFATTITEYVFEEFTEIVGEVAPLLHL